MKSVKLEKSEQGDCQKLLVLCSEFLLEVLEDEVLLVKWMECDKRGFLLVDTDHAVCEWNSDRTK